MDAEILQAIAGIKKCKSDLSTAPKKIYKQFSSNLVTPLLILFTNIITSVEVPKCMKVADCFPLYKKKGKLTQSSSYRAIFG